MNNQLRITLGLESAYIDAVPEVDETQFEVEYIQSQHDLETAGNDLTKIQSDIGTVSQYQEIVSNPEIETNAVATEAIYIGLEHILNKHGIKTEEWYPSLENWKYDSTTSRAVSMEKTEGLLNGLKEKGKQALDWIIKKMTDFIKFIKDKIMSFFVKKQKKDIVDAKQNYDNLVKKFSKEETNHSSSNTAVTGLGYNKKDTGSNSSDTPKEKSQDIEQKIIALPFVESVEVNPSKPEETIIEIKQPEQKIKLKLGDVNHTRKNIFLHLNYVEQITISIGNYTGQLLEATKLEEPYSDTTIGSKRRSFFQQLYNNTPMRHLDDETCILEGMTGNMTIKPKTIPKFPAVGINVDVKPKPPERADNKKVKITVKQIGQYLDNAEEIRSRSESMLEKVDKTFSGALKEVNASRKEKLGTERLEFIMNIATGLNTMMVYLTNEVKFCLDTNDRILKIVNAAK